MKSIIDTRKEHDLTEFLKLSPLDRMKIMYSVMSEIISIKAKAEGVSEYEIYRRYLKNNPRQEFLSQSREEPDEDLPGDLF